MVTPKMNSLLTELGITSHSPNQFGNSSLVQRTMSKNLLRRWRAFILSLRIKAHTLQKQINYWLVYDKMNRYQSRLLALKITWGDAHEFQGLSARQHWAKFKRP